MHTRTQAGAVVACEAEAVAVPGRVGTLSWDASDYGCWKQKYDANATACALLKTYVNRRGAPAHVEQPVLIETPPPPRQQGAGTRSIELSVDHGSLTPKNGLSGHVALLFLRVI
ncbi:uncharacterized protein LOC125225174 [Leguminivora glycinivorella]|uniref:uncharacterized protein LOC125224612 n=1 Tax=Leguminivora glycinivorella TaxID=1035111 RepID=UPI00200E6E06|nr:uncharacterized protein LOC125224612 [Leguminivora glycinivorella]XP_047984712.1 uncharacterized protein LOC125225174 [Leguminivora glycinivorella]